MYHSDDKTKYAILWVKYYVAITEEWSASRNPKLCHQFHINTRESSD